MGYGLTNSNEVERSSNSEGKSSSSKAGSSSSKGESSFDDDSYAEKGDYTHLN